MKTLATFLSLVIGLQAVIADDITTTDGKVYKDAKIVNYDARCATILYEDGGATIEIAKLNNALQQKLKYDPRVAAKAEAKEREDQTKEIVVKKQREVAALLAKISCEVTGKIVQVLPDGILADLSVVNLGEEQVPVTTSVNSSGYGPRINSNQNGNRN